MGGGDRQATEAGEAVKDPKYIDELVATLLMGRTAGDWYDPYSTNTIFAMEVLQKSFDWSCGCDPAASEEERYFCDIFDNDQVGGRGETLALAICRAALATKGVKV
jgi:hypothetical protein